MVTENRADRPEEPVLRLVAEARATAVDQLAAAWQLQIERLQEELSSGWREHLERIFEERFTELSSRLEAEFRSREEALKSARSHFSDSLAIGARRLRQHENIAEWSSALLEAAAAFAGRILLFSINGNEMHCEGARGVELPEDFGDIALPAAPAFAAAVESKDTVVAMRNRAELSNSLAAFLGDSDSQRFHLFPVVSRDRAAAVLYADSPDGTVEIRALEVLTALAGLSLESRTVKGAASPDLVSISNGAPQRVGWAALGKLEQDLHLRAQRFARVRVAEMRLYHSQAVKEGRTKHDLYTSLKQEIDTGRDNFRRDYLSASPTMVDYLHLELLRTLANDELDLLGASYPGPMV